MTRRRVAINMKAFVAVDKITKARMSCKFEALGDQEIEEAICQAEYYAYKYLAPVIFCLGMAGSLANLITLWHSKFSARIYVYLKALSVSDLGFLSFAISKIVDILNSHNVEASQNHDALYYSVHFETPIINGFLSASVFIIICMTLDRYTCTI
jgi:hypothetical protein